MATALPNDDDDDAVMTARRAVVLVLLRMMFACETRESILFCFGWGSHSKEEIGDEKEGSGG
jgi:hypothetical protein